jgi:hypothetical protein
MLFESECAGWLPKALRVLVSEEDLLMMSAHIDSHITEPWQCRIHYRFHTRAYSLGLPFSISSIGDAGSFHTEYTGTQDLDSKFQCSRNNHITHGSIPHLVFPGLDVIFAPVDDTLQGHSLSALEAQVWSLGEGSTGSLVTVGDSRRARLIIYAGYSRGLERCHECYSLSSLVEAPASSEALSQAAEALVRQRGHSWQGVAADPGHKHCSGFAEDAVPFRYRLEVGDGLTRYSSRLEETAVGILVDSEDSIQLVSVQMSIAG